MAADVDWSKVERCLLLAWNSGGASLRMCLREAVDLVAPRPQLSALIVAGAQAVPERLPPQVDVVLLPGVARGRRGAGPSAPRLRTDYETVRGLRMTLRQT